MMLSGACCFTFLWGSMSLWFLLILCAITVLRGNRTKKYKNNYFRKLFFFFLDFSFKKCHTFCWLGLALGQFTLHSFISYEVRASQRNNLCIMIHTFLHHRLIRFIGSRFFVMWNLLWIRIRSIWQIIF